MNKKITISESEKKSILNMHSEYKNILKEQSDGYERENVRAIQRFLNEKFKINLKVDGLTGPNSETSKAIERYQQYIGAYPIDGVWGEVTMNKMPKKDRQRLEDLIADEGGVVGQFINWVSKLF